MKRVLDVRSGFRVHGSRRGVTLTELVVAATLTFVVILAIGQVDMTRVFMEQQVRDVALVPATEVSMAITHMIRRLQQADRVKLLAPDNVQLRIPRPSANCPVVGPGCPVVCTGCAGGVPPPCCFDIPANYRWAQYRRVGNDLFFADDTVASCAVDSTFIEITGLTIQFQDVAAAPPGGEALPGGADNNLLEVVISGGSDTTFQAGATMRAGAYSDVNADCPSLSGPCDSGAGLAPVGVSEPPPPC